MFVVPYLSLGTFAFIAMGRWDFLAMTLAASLAFFFLTTLPSESKQQLIDLASTVFLAGGACFAVRLWLGHGGIFIVLVIISVIYILTKTFRTIFPRAASTEAKKEDADGSDCSES